MGYTRFFGLVTLLAVAAALTAQPPDLRLLTLDIGARDVRGNAVEDLRAEDLRVFDAGHEQKLAYFRRGQDVTAGAVPGKWCNYRYGTFPHVVVVLLDQLNSELELSGLDWDVGDHAKTSFLEHESTLSGITSVSGPVDKGQSRG